MTETPTHFDSPSRPGSRRRKLIIRLILATVFLAAAYAGWYCVFWIWRPMGEGPAGPAVPGQAFERTWSERKVVLLGIGDSITAGLGATDGNSYFDRLEANPADEFDDMKGVCLSAVYPNLQARNISVSGSDSLYHVKRIAELEPYQADTLGIIVMTTGGNDIIHNYGRTPPREGAMYGATIEQARPWIAAYAGRLETMVQTLKARFPGGCRIFLANIYDPTDGYGDAERAIPPLTGHTFPPFPDSMAILAGYNAAIAECADRHAEVYLVDIRTPFLGHGIHCKQFWRNTYRGDDPHFWFQAVIEDPNDRGYDAIRRLFLLKMIEVLAPAE